MNGYSDKLKNPKWQKKRLEILKRDNFSCRFCGCEDDQLQIHHKVYFKDKEPWEYDENQLITLCSECHRKATQVNNLIKIQLSKFNDIDQLQSINEILFNCSKLNPYEIDLVMDISELIIDIDNSFLIAIKSFISTYKQSKSNDSDPNYF